MTGRDSGRSAILLATVPAIGILGAAALCLTGVSIWPLVVVAGALLVLALGQRMSWSLALALSIGLMLAGIVLLLRVTPLLGIAPPTAVVSSLLLIAVAAAAALSAQRRRLRLPVRAAWTGFAISAVPAAALLVVAGVIAIGSAGTRLGWSMAGDAVRNFLAAHAMWVDGGFDSLSSAPLTPALMLAAWSSGPPDPLAGPLLAHTLPRTAELLILLLALATLLASSIAVRATRERPRWVRAATAILVATIPLSWMVAGLAFEFGHFNVLLAMVLMCSTWIAWQEAASQPIPAAATLALLTLAMLAAWAPLAVVGAGLLAAVAVLQWRTFFGPPWSWPKLIPIVCALGLAVYAGAVSLPSLLSGSAYLALDGGIAAITPSMVYTLGAAALVLGLIAALRRRGRRLLIGIAVIGVAGAAGLAYLVWQRRDMPVLWGYYPEKFAWLLCILFGVIVIAECLALLAELPRLPRAGAFALAGAALALAVSVTIPINTWAQPVLANALRAPVGPDAGDVWVADVMQLSRADAKTLVARWSDADPVVNYWLIWGAVAERTDAAVTHAELSFSTTDAEALCHVIGDWGGGVEVHTRDVGLASELDAHCAGDYRIVLGVDPID